MQRICLILSFILFWGICGYSYTCRVHLGDISIFHYWYFILGSCLLSFLTFIISFCNKIKMGIIYTFWFLSIVLALLSYWFRTERITILGSLTDFTMEYGLGKKPFNDLREKYPRKIFLFVGKPDNSYMSLKDEGDLHLDAEKSIEKLMEEMIKNKNVKYQHVLHANIEFYKINNKNDLNEAKKIIHNLRISKIFESGTVFLTTLYGVLDDKEGISFDEFKKEYKI